VTTINRSLALHVEGMGSSVSSSAGIAWYFGRATIGTPGDYEWHLRVLDIEYNGWSVIVPFTVAP